MAEFSSLNGYDVKDKTARNNIAITNQNLENEATTRESNDNNIIEKVTPFFEHETIKFREFDTNCYLTIVKKEECQLQIGIAYDDDTFASGREMTQDFARRKNADICVNASFWSVDSNGLDSPMDTLVIKDGVIIKSNIVETSTLQILCFDENGDMHIELANTSTSEGLLSKGYINCIQGFYGIMVDGIQINTDIVDDVGVAPINIIGQKENGDYVFLQSDGRNSKNVGLTMTNAFTILSRYDVKIAYMLDGGGSTSFNNKLIKQNQFLGDNNIDERPVYTFLYTVKNEKKTNTSLAFEEIGNAKQTLREEIAENIEANNEIFGDVLRKLQLITDANDIDVFGACITNTATVNTPVNSAFGVLITLPCSADGVSMIQYYVNRNYHGSWTRSKLGTGWTDWAHSNIPDPSGVRPVTFVRGDMRLNSANRPVWYTGEKWVYADGTDM